MEDQELRYNIPEKVFELDVKCPLCGGSAKLLDYKYNIPYYGDILISTFKCSECGFVHRDVFTLSGGSPRKIIYRVEKPGDENALVIRSSFCKIDIPELGLTIEPSAYSQGYITTIEGIIQDFIDILQNLLCKESDVDLNKCRELSVVLEKARNAEIPYTVIIYDYLGTSDIVSNKTIYEELKEPEQSSTPS